MQSKPRVDVPAGIHPPQKVGKASVVCQNQTAVRAVMLHAIDFGDGQANRADGDL
jgi:hypothetical protein